MQASSASTNEKESAPIPLVAARWIVSRRLHATHRGGCGFWSGFGTTFLGGTLIQAPSCPANGSSTSIRRHDVERLGPLVALR